MSRLLAAVALVLAAALTGATAQAAPSPAPSEFFGSNVQAMVRVGFAPPSSWPGLLRTGTDAGLTVARYDAGWAWAEPKAPGANGVHHYDWTQLDGIARVLASQGVRWLPVIDLPPDWARTPDNVLPDSAFDGFAAFAAAFAARYGSTGSFWNANLGLPRLPVQQAEVWTEANSTHFWVANPDASHYLNVFKVVRNAMKSTDPAMQVIVSLGWQDFEGYTNRLYDAGLAGQSDGIGFHPYAPSARGVISLTRKLRDVLSRHGEADLPIFVTEIGWPKAANGVAPAERGVRGPVSDQTRAATAAMSADALAASDCNVKNYIYYSLIEQQKDPTNIEDWLGLINRDGTQSTTLQALKVSTHRWSTAWGTGIRSGKIPMLPLCKGRTSDQVVSSSPMKVGFRLPVQLSIPMPATQRCMGIRTGYFGNPLEDVSVFVRTVKGKQAAALSHANGQAQICLSAQSRKAPFRVWARAGALGAAPVQSCRGKRCYSVLCGKASLSVIAKKPVKRRMKMKLRLKCGRRVLFGEPIRITAIDHRGNPILLKQLFTSDKRQTITLKLPSKPKLRAVKVRFKGDRALALKARVRGVRLR